MNSLQLILGNQLFYPLSTLDKQRPIVMIEHNDLCKYFKFHKIKIAFFFSAMRHYRDELLGLGYGVIYHTYNSNEDRSFFDVLVESVDTLEELHIIEIIDQPVRDMIYANCERLGIRYQVSPSPMFLNSKDDFSDYLAQVKSPFMKTFYEQSRRRFNVLMDDKNSPIGGKWSFDAENRKKCPKNTVIPDRVMSQHDDITNDVVQLVNNQFKDHPGDAMDVWLPVTRQGALEWWDHFKMNYFKWFGDYEDAIESRSAFLFHSGISSLINIGLLTPKEIISDALDCLDDIPLNALEGFIRQVLGWREFIRGIYDTYNDDQQSLNFWGATNQLTDAWYQGNTGHLPLDDAIKSTTKYAYSHHIIRLMVVGSTMMCCDIHPQEAYRWFMEMHVDGSDWVMGPNVFGMSQFSDGGIFATKPYLCGSNYIRKMSHYGRGDWCDIADGLYWRFIDKHSGFFKKNYRMRMAVSTLAKMQGEKRTKLMVAADEFIQKVTKQ